MAKAKLIESIEEFVVVLERSELFAPNQLDAIKKLAETTNDTVSIARALVKKGWVTKWQASQLLSGFYSLKVGKYRLVDHLGKGELGNVYLAENPKLGRKVALKSLSKQHTDSTDKVKRFLDEARAAAAFDHRNLVHVHDVSSERQRHYVVMEYVTGRDLQSRVDASGPVSEVEAASFMQQAAAGLQYVHEQGVVHRDLKPANVMVDDQGVVKILDVGVGHLRHSTGESASSASAYMAPEHARGDAVDVRSDIYSLGGVLYFLLTGRAPSSAKADVEGNESMRPIPLAELRSGLPRWLVDLCERMMAIEPTDRFSSMADVMAVMPRGDVGDASDVATVGDAVESAVEAGGSSTVVDNLESPKPDSKTVSEFKIDIGDAGKPAPAVAPTAITINTKRRKKKKPSAKPHPADNESVEKPVEARESESAETTSELSVAGDQPKPVGNEPIAGWSKRAMIASVCAGALLLITGVSVGVVMLLAQGDSDVVAQANPPATDTPDDPSEDSDIEEWSDTAASDDSQASENPNGASDTGAELASVSPSTDELIEAPSARATTAVVPASATVPIEPGDEAETPESPASDEATSSGPEIANRSTVAAADSSVVEEAPMAKAAAPAPAADLKPVEEEQPATEPKASESPKKKAPPKPKTFVFEPAIELPTPAADAAELTLGRINVREEDTIFISLVGGDVAASGRFEFSLQNAQDGVAPRDWEFYLSDGNSDSILIATMSLPERDLKFRWTPAGVANPTSTNLRNCSLRITAGQDQPQDLALRIPQRVAPFAIDLERSATLKLPLEGAPDRTSLKMEVTVAGHKGLVEPGLIELGRGGEAIIYFGENQEQAALALKLDASLNARGVQVKTDPYFLVPVEKSPVRLTTNAVKRYLDLSQSRQALLQNQVFEGERAAKERGLTDAQKRQIQGILAQLKPQLDLTNKTVEKMTQLATDMPAVGSNAFLQFRVFSDTFEKQIDLIVTDPKAAPVVP